MKRTLIFLSAKEYSEIEVGLINGYFNMGWEIEEILKADCGYYIIMVSKDGGNLDSDMKLDLNYTLLEEKVKNEPKYMSITETNDCVRTTTSKDVNPCS